MMTGFVAKWNKALLHFSLGQMAELEDAMAVKEGLRRVNKVGRLIGTAGAVLMVFPFVLVLVALGFPSSGGWPSFAIVDPLLAGVFLLLVGIAIVTVGWIGEGFAGRDESE